MAIARTRTASSSASRAVDSRLSGRVSFCFVAFIVFAAVCLFTGGSSRPDALPLLILRPVSVACIAVMLLWGGRLDLAGIKVPLIMIAILAAILAIQLVPMPPAMWEAMPARAQYTTPFDILDLDQPWRAWSLTPDLTLNALFALLPALATMLAYAGMTEQERKRLVLFPVLLALVSAVWGLIQLAGGGNSPAYLYRPTSDDLPVGLFANRNHQAVMLALAFPALGVWIKAGEGKTWDVRRAIAAACAAFVLLPVILVTGSRAGMACALGGLVLAMWTLRPKQPQSRLVRYAGIAAVLASVLVVGITIVAGRAASIDRLFIQSDLSTTQRLGALPVIMHIIRDYFPFGTGFGAFDQVFRSYETDAMLKPTYFNRAHNDLLEPILSGGLAILLLMLSFAIWWSSRLVQLAHGERKNATAFLGFALTAMLTLASIVDYPVRTPLATMVFALGCCWIARAAAAPAKMAASGLERG